MRPQRISVFRCRNQGPLGDASGWHLYDERAWGHHAKPAGKAGVTVAFKGKLGLPRSSNSPVLWAAATTEGPKPRSHARCFKQGPHRSDLPENCTCCRSDLPPDGFMASFTPFAFCCLACLAGLSDSLHVLGWCKLWPLQVCNPQVVEIT